MRTLATFLVWRLRTGACGVGACGFWRYRMPPTLNKVAKSTYTATKFGDKKNENFLRQFLRILCRNNEKMTFLRKNNELVGTFVEL